MELDRDTIQTTVQDGQVLQSVINNSPINFSTVISDVPQLQTVIQDNLPTIISVVEAPWVAVTSVNGMTGDVIAKASIDNFSPNTYYLKNTLTVYRRKLYFANETFTSGSNFNDSDWTEVSSSGGVTDITSEDETISVVTTDTSVDISIAETLEDYIQKESGKGLSSNDYTTNEKTKLGGIENNAQKNVQSDWNANSGDTYIKNKPILATVATSGSYNDLSGTPTIPTVNNATLTIQKNGSSVGTFTANASTDKSINITTPTKASDLVYDILDKIYPVGSIYMSATLDTAQKIHDALGGTWVSWGSGRVPVGVHANETEFNTAEKTGGEKTHTLTVSEMPSHQHILKLTSGSKTGGTGKLEWTGSSSATYQEWINDAPKTGGDQAHNNLPPYITCYMWKRTA